jgi:hypothetical protein
MDERARGAAERSGGTFLSEEEHGVWRFVSASMGAPAPRDPRVFYQMAVVTLANNFGRVTLDVAVSRKTDLLAEVKRMEKPDGTIVYRLESDLTITLAVEVSEAEYKRTGLGGMVKEAVRAVQSSLNELSALSAENLAAHFAPVLDQSKKALGSGLMQVVGGDARAGEVGLTLSGGCADEAEDGAADAPVPGSGVAGATTPPESPPVAFAPGGRAAVDGPPGIVQPRSRRWLPHIRAFWNAQRLAYPMALPARR